VDAEPLIRQLDEVLNEYDRAINTAPPSWQTIATRLQAAIERLSPRDSAYARQAADLTKTPKGAVNSIAALAGVARALRADLASGYMQTVEELAHADVFSDFLEMAAELHGSGYKDAAAVIAGSVLEDHLRKLAERAGVAAVKDDGSPKKASLLNAELAKAGAYNKVEEKAVTAWLDLRNKAAHAEYDEYDDGQVAALIRDVRDFMIRHPA